MRNLLGIACQANENLSVQQAELATLEQLIKAAAVKLVVKMHLTDNSIK